MSYVPMHEFGYTEEMIQTRLSQDIKGKQLSHEKLSNTKIETNENDIIKLSTKMVFFRTKMLDCETKLDKFWDTLSNPLNEQDVIKNIAQSVYDKALFDTFTNKDQFFESYLKFNEGYLLKKYGKEIVIDGNSYYLSDLEYETPRENIFQGVIKKELIDIFDSKQRMKLT